MSAMTYRTLESAVAGHGLILRGGFRVRAGDRVPDFDDGRPALTMVLVGNAGPAMWQRFKLSPEIADAALDPLNRWTQRIIDALAEDLGARALYPFGGPPHRPFVDWAKRCEPVRESPLGILIHPEFGLWHAYRGALAFATHVNVPEVAQSARPCDLCAEKPCLSACPVGAFDGIRYDLNACVSQVESPEGRECLGGGCQARRACPHGVSYGYSNSQAEFHTRAFLAARRVS